MLSLLILAGILEASTAIPYIRDIRKGRTKPAIVSWITWMVLSGIAGTAAFVEGASHDGDEGEPLCNTVSICGLICTGCF